MIPRFHSMPHRIKIRELLRKNLEKAFWKLLENLKVCEMEVFQQLRKKASVDLSRSLHEFLDLSRSHTITFGWSNSNRRDAAFRKRAASYEEYYFKKSNTRAVATYSPLINKFDRLEHNLTPKEMIKKRNYTQLEHRDLTSVYSFDSGFRDTSMFKECLISERKDSIADVELDNDQVQLTINHEPKTNLLHVSVHRATLTFPKDRRIYVKLCLLPNKLQKQRGKAIDLAKAKRWEEDFVFTNLSIGQLETCSIKIKIYQANGFLKRPLLKYEAIIALKDVDITNFRTTVLPLTTITNQLAHQPTLRRRTVGIIRKHP